MSTLNSRHLGSFTTTMSVIHNGLGQGSKNKIRIKIKLGSKTIKLGNSKKLRKEGRKEKER